MSIWIRIMVALSIAALFVVGFGIAPEPAEATGADTHYWVGGSGNWTDTAHWSHASGGAGGAGAPGTGNAVIINAASAAASFTITLSGTGNNCASFDCSAIDDALSFASGSGTGETRLNVYGNFVWAAALASWSDWGAPTNPGPDYLMFKAAATVTSNGGQMYCSTGAGGYRNGPIFYIDTGGGAVTMADSFQVGMLQRNTGTLTTGANTLTVRKNFYGGAQTYGNIAFNCAADNAGMSVTGANTFTNLTITHDNKVDFVSFEADQTISGTLTLDGTSASNRLFIQSNSTTQRTLTAAAVTADYTDFYSIIGAGAGSWDLSAVGEDAIDFTNNSGITFAWPYSSTRDYYWTGHNNDGGFPDGGDVWDAGILSGGGIRTAYNWSTTSGGAGGAYRLPNPGPDNNVYFDANSGFTVGDAQITISGTTNVYAKDLDFTGSDAVTPPIIYNGSGAYTCRVEVYGDLTFVAGMTGDNYHDGWVLKGSGDLTTNGVIFDYDGLGPLFVQSTGTYVAQDDITFEGGPFTFFNHTSGTFDTTTNTVTIYHQGTGSSSTFAGIGITQTYYGLTDTASGTLTITGSNNITNFTRHGTATLMDGLKFAADQYFQNFTVHGYGGIYRMQFGSSAAGTQRQCSVMGTVSVEYTDLSDSAKVGTGNPDISAGNNSDFGGNLGWIFDTGYFVYWVNNSGQWSDLTNHWANTSGGTPGTGRIPLIQDIAVFDGNSFTIPLRTVTIDITNIGAIWADTVTNSPTFSKAGTVDIYGDVRLGTLTWSVTTTNFKGLDTEFASTATFTTAMHVLKNDVFDSTLYLASNMAVTGTVYVDSGVFDHNDWNLTATTYDSLTTTYNRTIKLGSGVTTLNGTSAGNKWAVASTKLTLYAEDSTIIMTNSGANGQTFAGASLTYNNLTQTGAGAWAMTVSGTNTFDTLTIDRSAANKTITGSVTCTISAFMLDVSGTRTITITNTDFTMATGVVLGDYLIISGSAAGGGATFFANVGGHSTDGGGNSGWIWTPPIAPTVATLAATDVTYLGERLNGELLTKGSYVTFYCYFEYGPTVSYGFVTPETTKTAVGTWSSYLSPYKVYHYRAVVRFGYNDHVYGNDMTVSISGGVKNAKAAVADPGADDGVPLVSTVPAAIPRMYDEGSTAGIPLAPLIDPALAESSTPVVAFWYPIAFLIAILLGFAAYAKTRSLLLQCLVSGITMAAFAGGGTLGTGLLPFWTVLVFLIEGILVWLIQEKQSI